MIKLNLMYWELKNNSNGISLTFLVHATALLTT